MFNPIQFYEFGKSRGGNEVPNLFIGGVSNTMGTPTLLASYLRKQSDNTTLPISEIKNFAIKGNNISCYINLDYLATFTNNTEITYIIDYKSLKSFPLVQSCFNLKYFRGDGIVNLAVSASTLQANNLQDVILHNCVSVSSNAFNGTQNQTNYYIPKCTVLGGDQNNNTIFYTKPSSKIYVDPFLATSNSGSPDGDLTASVVRSDIIYVTNFSVPNPINDLTISEVLNTAVKCSFTVPTGNTNALDFYEVYVDGIYNNKGLSSNLYATCLEKATTYKIEVVAIDIFRNSSLFSNSVTVSTSNYVYDSESISFNSICGITIEIEKESNHILFSELKASNLWGRINAIYPFKGGTQTSCKFNAKNPIDSDAAFRLTYLNTININRFGFFGGSARTSLIPSNVNLLNSNALTIYTGNTLAAGYDIGAWSSSYTKVCVLGARFANNNNSKRGYANGTLIELINNSDSRGSISITKQSATVSKLIKDGVVIKSGASGGTLPTHEVYIGSMNAANSVFASSNNRIQIAAIHEGFSDSETVLFHSILDKSEIINNRKDWLN
jgi:hypothetical protein